MTDLFYTPGDEMIFWVSGYDIMSNEPNLIEATSALIKDGKRFADVVGCDIKEVRTFHNSYPPRFQYMRVYYVKKTLGMKVPGEAYVRDGNKTVEVSKRDDKGRPISWEHAIVPITMMDVLTR